MIRRQPNQVLRLAAVGLLVAACGGDDKPANTGGTGATQCPPGQFFDGQFCQNQAGVQPTATAPAPAPTAGAPAAPPVAPIATATAGPTATPLDPAAAAAATQLMTPIAQTSAPGAKPVGSPIAGQFQQGQSLEGQIQMQPNKCYTIIGVGLPPIVNLDIQLAPFVAVPGLPAAVLAQDSTVASTAIIGEKQACYRSGPIALPMKVIATVSQGNGVAAVQVYEK
jgi:hypothetical protein